MKEVVNAIILKADKFLIIKRKSGIHTGLWAFPGGIVEDNEAKEQALRREVYEETGLQIVRIIRKISDYEYPRQDRELTKGESFLVSVKSSEIKPNHEIDSYKWVTLEEFSSLEHVPGLEDEALNALYD